MSGKVDVYATAMAIAERHGAVVEYCSSDDPCWAAFVPDTPDGPTLFCYTEGRLSEFPGAVLSYCLEYPPEWARVELA